MDRNDSFEALLARLEEITTTLGQGNIPLDDVISLYREGYELFKKCSKMLEEAEMSVKKVTEDSEGCLTEQNFIGGE